MTLPARVAPQLATLVSEPPEGPDWVREQMFAIAARARERAAWSLACSVPVGTISRWTIWPPTWTGGRVWCW